MQRMLVLARRELAAYFFSPMAYVVTGLFLLAMSLLFLVDVNLPGLRHVAIIKPGAESSLDGIFTALAYGLVFVTPLLTMRLMAEEYYAGTIETLMTAPVTDAHVIGGKFLGAMGMYLALLALTLPYFLLVAILGQPDLGRIALGYLGMLLLGATYIAVGLFASTLTRYQLVAGLIGIAILALFTVGIYLLAQQIPGRFEQAIRQLNVVSYLDDFARGKFNTRGQVFFLSITGFFLFLSVKVLESRRWR